MRIFAGFPREGRQTTVGLSTTAIFSVFAGYIFEDFGDEVSIIICRHAVYYWLFSDPKIYDLSDLEWLFRVELFSRRFSWLRPCDFRKIIA